MSTQEAMVTTPEGRRFAATLWTNGERNREPRIGWPCECGCQSGKGVAYLTASDADGNGITIWLRTEYDIVEAVRMIDDPKVKAFGLKAALALPAGA